MRDIPIGEVRVHDSRQSCWIIVAGLVYDVTAFVTDVRQMHR